MRKRKNKEQYIGLIILLILLLISGVLLDTLKRFPTQAFKLTTEINYTGLLMTPDELRTYEGFEDMDDEMAKKYIYLMQQLCFISFDSFNNGNKY